MYNKGMEYLAGPGDWSAGGDTYRLFLVTSTYVFSAAHSFESDLTNEITNTGYTAGGHAITTRSVDTSAQALSDNVTITALAAGDQPDAAIIIRDTGTPATSELICYCSLTTPPAPNGGDYTINQPATGWFNLAN